MNTWFCLTPNMLTAIASCSGIVYFINVSRCSVKMNGLMVKIQRVDNEWFASSSNERFYDLVAKHSGTRFSRGSVIQMNEIQMFGVLTYICKINPEEEK